MKKVIIAGSRTFNDYDFLCEKLTEFITEQVVILSGCADGADKLGEKYAKDNGFVVEHYPAKWDDLSAIPCKLKYNKFGKPYNALAGYNRNKQMLQAIKNNKDGGMVIVFWDGVSRGTKDMIDISKQTNIPVIVVRYV